jgi:polysaccharide pyruvyl transferase WcaK-like protein
MMKVILHGATGGSNYGDYLFAELFYKTVENNNKQGENLFFEFSRFGFSSYFRKELQYKHKQTFRDLKEADLMVLFSGGYFGERNNTLKENTFRFMRYVPVSTWFILRKKPIIISGVGGGPITNPLLRKSMTFIMKNAELVSVRDEETKAYYSHYGVDSKKMIVTSDTAQVIDAESLDALDKSVENNFKSSLSNKKIIFLHIYGKDDVDQNIKNKIVPALNEFLKENKEFGVVVGCDWKSKIAFEKHPIFSALETNNKTYYEYTSPNQFSAFLNHVDLILTPKLHVGILGSTFSKSVLSFPMHKEKTLRYYKQIEEEDRCLPLDGISSEEFRKALTIFSDKKINLPDSIKEAANYNLEMVKDKILEIKKQK